MDPVGVWTPIMSLPRRFHGDMVGTRDAYGPNLSRDALSGSPSSSMIWMRSLCASLFGRAGEDGGCPPIRAPFGGEGAAALILARVGACADELRLMGVERGEVHTEVGRAVLAQGSLSRKELRACGSTYVMERMWKGLWGDGANWTTQFVERGGSLRDRRSFLVGRLVAIKGGRS